MTAQIPPAKAQSGVSSSVDLTRRLVVIEDDESVLEVLREALVGRGYETFTAGSAREGLELIRDRLPDLVLTDQDMPGQTGLELLRELRSQHNYVAVIFVSARGDSHLVTQALRGGADDYVRKPFRLDELMARIEACLRTRDLHHELLKANRRLQEMVEHDDLTGLFNMRSMYQRIDGELRRSFRSKRKIACIMLDMDHFKRVNDQHDHLFGSFVLKEMGQIIREQIRASDFAARYGGDEFMIVLTETDAAGAQVFCERLRQAVAGRVFQDGQSQIQLTISQGCAVTSGQNVDARQLVREADHRLYRAKELGRNRSVIEDV